MASRRELLMKANQANSSRIKLQKDQETIVDAIVNELEDDSDKEKLSIQSLPLLNRKLQLKIKKNSPISSLLILA